MSGPFYLWSTTPNLFTSASGQIPSVDWNRSNIFGGAYPLFVDAETDSTSTTTPVSWNIWLMSGDWVGTVEPAQLVATASLIDPFGATGNIASGTMFTGGSTRTGALFYWSAPTSTAGDYQFNFVPITETIPSGSTSPSNTTLGTATVLDSVLANPTTWTFATNGTSTTPTTEIVFGLGVADPSVANTTDYYIQGVTAAGVASAPVELGELPASDWTSVSYTSSNSTFYANYAQATAAGFTFYSESFNPATNALGAPSSYLSVSGYTSITGSEGFIQPNGAHNRFVSGFDTINGQSTQVIQDFLGNGSPAAVDTVTLASASADHWQAVQVLDVATQAYDETALVYADGNQVHLELFNEAGVEIGADMLASNLTSFDRVQDLGSRIEIDYTTSNGSGGQTVGSVIYDTASVGYTDTLGGSGEYVGSPFDDTFTDGAGDYIVNGGGGTDTFVVNYAASQVQFSEDSSDDVLVSTSGGVATLERFSKIDLSDATVTISGSTLSLVSLETNARTAYHFNIAGQIYTSTVYNYDSDRVLQSISFDGVTGQGFSSFQYDYARGSLSEIVYDVPVSAGAGDLTSYNVVYSPGSQLIGEDYFYTFSGGGFTGEEIDFNGAGQTTAVDVSGVTGTWYSSYVSSYVGGVYEGTTYTAASVPTNAPYSSYALSYDYSGNYAGTDYFFTGLTGAYKDEEQDYNAAGQLTKVVMSDITGEPFKSEEIDYAAGSVYAGSKFFYTGITGQSYTGEELDISAAGATQRVIYTGLTGTAYSSLEEDFSGGALSQSIYDFTNVSGTGSNYYATQLTEGSGGANLQQTYDLASGGHVEEAFDANQSLTSLGQDTMYALGHANTTFLLNPNYGSVTIEDFNPTSGDVLSVASSDFSSVAAILDALQTSNGNTTLTAPDHDTITLVGVTKAQLSSTNFLVHS